MTDGNMNRRIILFLRSNKQLSVPLLSNQYISSQFIEQEYIEYVQNMGVTQF